MEVPALNDPRLLVPIPVPLKGRKPITLKLPRFDFIDEDQHDAIEAAAKAADDANKELPLRKRQRLADLALLKPFVSEKDYQACESLTSGQLQVLIKIWATGSQVALGELLASEVSSTENTGAQSPSTSIAEGGPERISGAA